jgi:hypothetical protein
MDALHTLNLLSEQMELEHAEESRSEPVKPPCFTPKEQRAAFVQPAHLPNGKQIKLLKTLLSSASERDGIFGAPHSSRRNLPNCS